MFVNETLFLPYKDLHDEPPSKQSSPRHLETVTLLFDDVCGVFSSFDSFLFTRGIRKRFSLKGIEPVHRDAVPPVHVLQKHLQIRLQGHAQTHMSVDTHTHKHT